MNSPSVMIDATGAVTGVGLNAPSTCAAVRAAVDNFRDTGFKDSHGEWFLGSEVPLIEPWRGVRRLAKMLSMAMRECAENGQFDLGVVPVLLCLSEPERPGRSTDFSARLVEETRNELGLNSSGPAWATLELGRVGGLAAIHRARKMIHRNGVSEVVIAAVDSLLTAPILRLYESVDRLLTSRNSNGFIPGEAASAILLRATKSMEPGLRLLGLGYAKEEATIDAGLPLRGNGLTDAISAAFADSGRTMDDMDFRIVDVSGEHYSFKESALALGRLLRVHKERFPLWHPTDCIGEVGAAIVCVCIAYLVSAYEMGFSPGPHALHHVSNDDGKRAAAVFQYVPSE